MIGGRSSDSYAERYQKRSNTVFSIFAIDKAKLPASAKPEARKAVRLVRGALVELKAVEALGPNVLTGDAIQFRVARPLELEGAAPIPKGSIVTGVIKEVEKCV